MPAELLAKHGAVSAEVAQAMAEGALRASGADIAVAVTGIAGPTAARRKSRSASSTSASPRKGGKTETRAAKSFAVRDTFKYMASQIALDLVRRALA